MEYTLDVHVGRLKRMLLQIEEEKEKEEDDITRSSLCFKCPATPSFSAMVKPGVGFYSIDKRTICKICTSFVDIPDPLLCPCLYYGEEKAIRLSWEAIRQYESAIKFKKQ